VVTAPELTRTLDRDDVSRVLDDAEDRGVTAIVGTDGTAFGDADVEADRAEHGALFDLDDRSRQTSRILGSDFQQMKGDPLSGLRTDAREPPELVDEVLDRAFEQRQSRLPR
jgi:hypothetical protein